MRLELELKNTPAKLVIDGIEVDVIIKSSETVIETMEEDFVYELREIRHRDVTKTIITCEIIGRCCIP